jgi:Nif-specific regulatory protein
VRQLENCIERLVIMADRDRVNAEDLPFEIRIRSKQVHNDLQEDEINRDASSYFSLTKTVKDMEKERIINALQKCGWVKSRAATLLGISPRQVDYRINKYGIEIKKPWEESA